MKAQIAAAVRESIDVKQALLANDGLLGQVNSWRGTGRRDMMLISGVLRKS